MTTENFHFAGRVGCADAKAGRTRDVVHRPAEIWHYEADDFAIGVGGEHARTVAAWQNPVERLGRPSVFVAGSLYLGSDGEYGESTSVRPLPIESAPEVIADASSSTARGLLHYWMAISAWFFVIRNRKACIWWWTSWDAAIFIFAGRGAQSCLRLSPPT